jgi:hypothetical protein
MILKPVKDAAFPASWDLRVFYDILIAILDWLQAMMLIAVNRQLFNSMEVMDVTPTHLSSHTHC